MILEGFKFSINFLKDNFRKLITILSIPIILELMLNSFNSFSETDEGFTTLYLVTTLGLFVQTWAQCMLIVLIAEKESTRSFSDLSIYTLYKLPIVIIWSLFVGLAVTLGFFLLILPGIYIGLRYFFYVFEILLSSSKSGQAMKDTFAMTDGKVMQIFLYLLPLMFIAILLSLSIYSLTDFFIIGILYNYLLIIFSALYSYYLYTRIKSSTNGT
ncbi:hypothetical protein N9T78_01050 [Gammaproteobacteria bacterium]|nr:hypothetical protein [Gammaproteobacteria bacterium]